jgi:hypothetical protein
MNVVVFTSLERAKSTEINQEAKDSFVPSPGPDKFVAGYQQSQSLSNLITKL